MRDEEWAVLEPLIDEVRPHAKAPIADLRRRIEGIFWRHDNGAKLTLAKARVVHRLPKLATNFLFAQWLTAPIGVQGGSRSSVGIFPSEASIIRLLGAALLEQNDEWSVQTRYMQVEAMAELAAIDTADPIQISPLAA